MSKACDIAPGAPSVSVIVPAYNAATTITATLRSVLEQTYRQLEVLVVDDGSTDATADVVATIAETDPRVRLIRTPNRGVAAARNTALECARGEYVAPVDADDIWFPDKIEQQVRRACEVPEAGLIYAWTVHVNDHGALTGGYVAADFEGHVYPALVHWCFVGNASTPLFRRDCLEQVGGYDTALHRQSAQGCEDLDVYLRIARRWPFAVVPEFLVAYRLSAGNMSRQTRSMARSFRIVMARARAAQDDVPHRVFRWSHGHFLWYLGWQCARTRHHAPALGYQLAACLQDPAQLGHPDLGATLREALRRAARYPVGRWRARAGARSEPRSDPRPDPHEEGAGNVAAPFSYERYRAPLASLRAQLDAEPATPWERLQARRREQVRALCTPLPARSASRTVLTEVQHP